MNTQKPTCLLIAFAGPAYEHWAARFATEFGGNVDRLQVPEISDAHGIVTGLPVQRDGTVILVNARIAAALTTSYRKRVVSPCGAVGALVSTRDDIYCLPVGAPQDDSQVGMDFLVKVE